MKRIWKLVLSIVMVLGMGLCCACGGSSAEDEQALEYIQKFDLFEDGSTNIKTLFENYWKDGEWDSFESEDGRQVVEYKVDDNNIVQFQLADDSMENNSVGDFYMVDKGEKIEDKDAFIEKMEEAWSACTGEEYEEYLIPIEVWNNTGGDIAYLYASVSQTNDWEEDILGETGVLPDQEMANITFTFDNLHTVWDFKTVDAEGNESEFYDIDFAGCSQSGITMIFNADGTVEWE